MVILNICLKSGLIETGSTRPLATTMYSKRSWFTHCTLYSVQCDGCLYSTYVAQNSCSQCFASALAHESFATTTNYDEPFARFTLRTNCDLLMHVCIHTYICTVRFVKSVNIGWNREGFTSLGKHSRRVCDTSSWGSSRTSRKVFCATYHSTLYMYMYVHVYIHVYPHNT